MCGHNATECSYGKCCVDIRKLAGRDAPLDGCEKASSFRTNVIKTTIATTQFVVDSVREKMQS